MILCPHCKGTKRDPAWSADVDYLRCPLCGGSGLDAHGVQEFAQELVERLQGALSLDELSADLERLRAMIGPPSGTPPSEPSTNAPPEPVPSPGWYRRPKNL